ncbi:SIR2 family protein [Pseudomonas sp. DCB_BG]|uniref:SIR2 family protein n=1 Tax=Pseudomonas sp. DCB_BG TaxID=2993595 RepID=UPI002248801B|nr:SIR2 family protein [Pseudomonas sp. DCB_BG]MCX2708617.1 SIR2 family protein [Pseudomonas sp. DCB_BG]
MHSLILGNGINRVAMQKGWGEILRELAIHFDGVDLLPYIETKPLSMFVEELCARSKLSFRKAEHEVKVEFAGLLKQIKPVLAHERICNLFKVILTTNYDFTIEEALAGPMHSPDFLAPESRYSLFRRHIAANKEIWHIHGDVGRPGSMLLGFDHYAGNLQKIRNYVTDSVEVKGAAWGRVSSAAKGGNLEFTDNRKIYSWVDYFLRDHLHIVGLSLDFTEIDLWWLLLHKRRRLHQPGKVFFYHVYVGGEEKESPVISLLKSLDVEVVSVVADNYHDGYLHIAELIKERIDILPGLFSKPAKVADDVAQGSKVRAKAYKQVSFKFPRESS